jgi:transcription antitermination factor NusG
MPKTLDTTKASQESWFATTVMPQHEAAVVEAFTERGLQPFSPTYPVTKQWSDRKKTLRKPLFSGYVLCRFTRNDCATVLNTPGVRSIVSFGGQPAVVPDRDIEQIAAMVDSGRPLQPWPYIDRGEEIRVDRGPLKGITGFVVDTSDERRLVVSVMFLRRSVCVTVDRDFLTPVRDSSGIQV